MDVADDGQTYVWGSNLDNRLGLGIGEEFTGTPVRLQQLNDRAVFWVSCGAKSVVASIGTVEICLLNGR